MSTTAILKSPFTLNGNSFNDGDYVSLSIPQPSWPNTNAAAQLSIWWGGYGNAQTSGNAASPAGAPQSGPYLSYQSTIGVPYASLGPMYVCGPGSINFTYAGIGSSASTIIGATSNQPIPMSQVATNSSSVSQLYGNDAVLATGNANQQQFSLNSPTAKCSYQKPIPAGMWSQMGLAAKGQYFDNTNYVYPPAVNTQVSVTNMLQYQLCMEVHADSYIAFRASNGSYLQLKTQAQAPNSTYPGLVNYVATFTTNVPSSDASTQWQLYAVNTSGSSPTNVVLLNKATNTCLSIDPKLQTVYNPLNMTGNGTVYTSTGGTDAYEVALSMPTARLSGTLSLTQAQGTTFGPNASFTLNRIAVQPCNLSINPLSASCTNPPASSVIPFCSVGDMATTANCSAYFRANADSTASVVQSYCAANPDDVTFCGCLNIWSYRGINDILSYSQPPGTVLPKCNITSCATNSASWQSSTIQKTNCAQQICLTSTFIDTVTDSSVNGIKQSCNLTSTTIINAPSSGS